MNLLSIQLICMMCKLNVEGDINMDIQSMTLKEKIGQLCMIGLEGTSIQAETMNLLTNFHIGNVFLTNKNMKQPKQVHRLTQNLQSYSSKLPLFIATKQGGGLQNSLTSGVTISPDQQTLGEINNQLYTRQIAQVVSEELRAMGVNLNLYPHANISNDDDTSFGMDSNYTAKHVVAAIQGCQQSEVIPAVLDFPGVGDLQTNIDASLTHMGSFRKTALQPFIKAIEADAPIISITNELTTHSQSSEPAVFSPIIVQALLREKLGFNGIIMTNDLADPLITDQYTVDEAAIRALEAGVDLLVIGGGETEQITVLEAINEAVQRGSISEERIDASVTRVLQVKQAFPLDQLIHFDRDQFRKQWSVKLESLLEKKSDTVKSKA